MRSRLRGLALPDFWRDPYRRLLMTKRIVRYGTSALAALVVILGAAYFNAGAWQGDVIYNGNFEHGFHVEPCGVVGNHWHCFTNGGAANYGFYDEQWSPVVSDGVHGQLIEINTKGMILADPDRYAGIYQTVRVTDWADYQLKLHGMIRTTVHDGDPWRYRVEVGWTHGAWADWTKVDNWRDLGWDTYYDRLEPGTMRMYSTNFTAKDDYVTIYIRFWKKWGVPEEEILLNLDSISLIGAGYNHYAPTPTPIPTVAPTPYVHQHKPHQPKPHHSKPEQRPQVVHGPVSCNGPDYMYNGGFEHGFNDVGFGHVGKGWGAFTNGGAADYGFYDEQWLPVVVEGAHGQLIEINAKGIYPADPDRYAGIYQRITGLTPGVTYQFSLHGLLRGAGVDEDPDRFVAQWGYNNGRETDWARVTNWTSMNLGTIYPRTEPGNMGSYSAQFKAESHSIVLFLRGWKKWGITDVEMDLNFDAIRLTSCVQAGGHTHSHGYKQHNNYGHNYQKSHGTGGPVGGTSCTYTIQPGDTLGLIAERYWVTLHDLSTANSIYNPNLIFVGQVLHIPGCTGSTAQPAKPHVPVAQPAYRTHTVRPGDTLSAICLQYGLDHGELVRINNITNPNWIYVGQELVLP